jgi:hypothetical protein
MIPVGDRRAVEEAPGRPLIAGTSILPTPMACWQLNWRGRF